jgi:hypothetical protein
MSTARITVVHKRPGERATTVEVNPNDLSALQALLDGGYLETLGFILPRFVLVVDEDGRQKGLAPNIRDPLSRRIVGPVFVAKTKGSEFVTMTPAQVAVVTRYLDGRAL